MTQARRTLVSIEDTPYCHCIGRCVRRAFLCGFDQLSQRSFEHRRKWMRERLALLVDTFAIDLCAYTLMSNHYHLVVRLCPERVETWSDREGMERWARVSKGASAARRHLNHEPLTDTEYAEINQLIIDWRERLGNLSWFMRTLNEYIARKANAEDDCTGHFWEARFKSQALLDETAVLTTMAYVDLNPVRSKMAKTIGDSAFTSGQDRLRAVQKDGEHQKYPGPRLVPFREVVHQDALDYLPCSLKDYLDLLDTTGRVIVTGKRGFIIGDEPRLLQSLDVDPNRWLDTLVNLQSRYELAMGAPEKMLQLAKRWGKRWLHGSRAASRLYAAVSP